MTSALPTRARRSEDQAFGSARQRRTRITLYYYTKNPTLNKREIQPFFSLL